MKFGPLAVLYLLLLGLGSWAWAAEPPKDWHQVLNLNAGTTPPPAERQAGSSWRITAAELAGVKLTDERLATFDHGPELSYRLAGLRPGASYKLRLWHLNVVHPRQQSLLADGQVLYRQLELPIGVPVERWVDLPAAITRDGVVTLTLRKDAGFSALLSAAELWSNEAGLRQDLGDWLRFQITAMPPKEALWITATLKLHRTPWNAGPYVFGPAGLVLAARGPTHSQPGFTPWYDLRKLPHWAGEQSLLLSIAPGARGVTQLASYPDERAIVREIAWDEPDGLKLAFQGINRVRTFRDYAREHYFLALTASEGRLWPLTRPPQLFSNAWGYARGPAGDYMVKTMRLLGLNSVTTAEQAERYERLYGWGSQGGQYSPPFYWPFDPPTSEAMYRDHFTGHFKKASGLSPGMLAYQVADEPVEPNPPNYPHVNPAFQAWLAKHELTPEFFGATAWDSVKPHFTNGGELPERRLYYWSRRWRGELYAQLLGQACAAVRTYGPNPQARAFVALSGHAWYMPGIMSVDMFELARHPAMTPGISDWMTFGSWRWDADQAVAFSVAPFNAGARQYRPDGGRDTPLTWPMMHCVNPSLERAWTQLANQCKLISYYNYGPSFEVTEGYWSDSSWAHQVVARINHQVAQVDDLVGAGQMRPSRVAMLYSMSNEYLWPTSSLADKRAAFLGLSHEYYQPELISEDQVLAGALAHYDAVFVLDAFVQRAVQGKLGEWLKAGGLLWACNEALVRDEYGEPCDLLAEVAGLRREFSGARISDRATLQPVPGDSAFTPHQVSRDGLPNAVTWPDATVRATYQDGRAAWLEKPVAKGRLVYLGHRAGLAYTAQAQRPGGKPTIWSDTGRAPLTLPLHEAKIARPFWLSHPLIMAQSLASAAGEALVLYPLAGEQAPLTISLRTIKRPVSVQGVNPDLSLADLAHQWTDGVLSLTLPRLPWHGQLVAVRYQPAPPDPRPAEERQRATAALASTHPEDLSAGAWLAGFYPAWADTARLASLLDHADWRVRRAAGEALGRLRHQDSAPLLEARLAAESDSHVQADLLLALAQVAPARHATWLTPWLSHRHPIVRQAAQQAHSLATR